MNNESGLVLKIIDLNEITIIICGNCKVCEATNSVMN